MKSAILLICTLFVLASAFTACTKIDEDDMRIAFLGGSQCMHGFKSTPSFQSESFPLKDKVMERLGLKEGNLEVVAMEGAGAARPEFNNSGTMNLCRQAMTLTQRKACDVYHALGRDSTALHYANLAVTISEEKLDITAQAIRRSQRAYPLEALGRYGEALSDLQMAEAVFRQTRSRHKSQ